MVDVISAHVEPTFIQDIYCDSVVAQIKKVTQAVLIRTSLDINKHLYLLMIHLAILQVLLV